MTARLIAGAAIPAREHNDADIIILSLNRAAETIAAIRSACAQTGVSTHVFVLDQGSHPDAVASLVAEAADHANTTVFAIAQNLGVAGGRNLLSALGRGRIIVALDNDAEFGTRDTVAHMVAALDAEPRLGAVACHIIRADGADDLSSWGYPAKLIACAGENFDTVTFVGAGHAIRRACWEQAGGYDSRLFFCWEEFDFCLRAIALGWRVRYRGDIVICHKVTEEQRVLWAAARWFYFVRNRLYIERKLGRNWLDLTPRIAGYLLRGVSNGLALETLRAIAAAVHMGPRAAHRPLPAAATSYLHRNDRAHRGSLVHRLMYEVLSRIGRPSGVALTAKQ